MIKEEDKDVIASEFKKTLLNLEKENLAKLEQKSDYQMVDSLYNEFEKVVTDHEDK